MCEWVLLTTLAHASNDANWTDAADLHEYLVDFYTLGSWAENPLGKKVWDLPLNPWNLEQGCFLYEVAGPQEVTITRVCVVNTTAMWYCFTALSCFCGLQCNGNKVSTVGDLLELIRGKKKKVKGWGLLIIQWPPFNFLPWRALLRIRWGGGSLRENFCLSVQETFLVYLRVRRQKKNGIIGWNLFVLVQRCASGNGNFESQRFPPSACDWFTRVLHNGD